LVNSDRTVNFIGNLDVDDVLLSEERIEGSSSFFKGNLINQLSGDLR